MIGYLDTPVEPEYDIMRRVEGGKGKDGFALPNPLIYERVTNLKIP